MTNKLLLKSSKVIAKTAMAITAMNVNSVCILFIHQPKLPEGAKKLRKF